MSPNEHSNDNIGLPIHRRENKQTDCGDIRYCGDFYMYSWRNDKAGNKKYATGKCRLSLYT